MCHTHTQAREDVGSPTLSFSALTPRISLSMKLKLSWQAQAPAILCLFPPRHSTGVTGALEHPQLFDTSSGNSNSAAHVQKGLLPAEPSPQLYLCHHEQVASIWILFSSSVETGEVCDNHQFFIETMFLNVQHIVIAITSW